MNGMNTQNSTQTSLKDDLSDLYTMDYPPIYETIKKGEFKGYEYYILWFRDHPNAYIKIPKGDPLYEKDYTEIELEYEPHGCLTYSSKNVYKGYGLEDGWYIGWDYNHSVDYANSLFFRQGFRHTTEEIENECKCVINGIIGKDKA